MSQGHVGGHREGSCVIREAGHSSHLLMSYNPVCMKYKHTPRERREKKGHTPSAKRNTEEAVPAVASVQKDTCQTVFQASAGHTGSLNFRECCC